MGYCQETCKWLAGCKLEPLGGAEAGSGCEAGFSAVRRRLHAEAGVTRETANARGEQRVGQIGPGPGHRPGSVEGAAWIGR
jgi:hypothetical protein